MSKIYDRSDRQVQVPVHAVQVNEARVNATRAGAGWWFMFCQRFRNIGRITETSVSIGGAWCLVACDDEDHAEWLAHSMINDHGLPRSAVRVLPHAKRGAS